MLCILSLLLASLVSSAPVVDKADGYHLFERQLPPGDACERLVGTSGGEFIRSQSKHRNIICPASSQRKMEHRLAYNLAYSPRTILACLETIPFDSSVRDNVMGVAAAMYSMDVFAANQLGDDDVSTNQGVNIQEECE